jgi:hypothetical protein
MEFAYPVCLLLFEVGKNGWLSRYCNSEANGALPRQFTHRYYTQSYVY